jgi:hypothetical protein
VYLGRGQERHEDVDARGAEGRELVLEPITAAGSPGDREAALPGTRNAV